MNKVLIVDDEPTTRKLLSTAVNRMGYVTIVASDGRRAWETLLDNPDIELLVTDMMMPGLDGREFLELVRSHPDFKSLPVIIVSGIISMNDVVDLLERGASRFLPKPVDIAEFKRYVSLLLETASMGQNSPSAPGPRPA